VRALVVFTRLLPFVVAFLRDRRRWVVMGKPRRASPEKHQARARRLVATVAALGPAFIKLAQVFASRADIVPEPYLAELSGLTDRVPPLPFAEIERVIGEEYGTPASAVFTEMESEPIAAASLGQVHRARVRANDGCERDVAVKVLRPGVDELVGRDLDAAFRILYFLNILFPNHHTRAITNIVGEFAKRIAEEMDFRLEAENARVIKANFANDPRVLVPAVLEELTRRRVLVLEFVEGTRVDRLHARMAAGELDFPRVLETIVELYVRMMLVDGIFHADPHPGNLLVAPDGRVALLDFGMVIRVEQETRQRLITTVMAAVRQDVDGVIAGLYELGMLDPEVDRGTIRDAARAIMSVAFRTETTPRQIQRIVNEVMATFYRWPVMLPSELVYFGRAAALIEGLGFAYDPTFNGATFVRPVVERMRPELVAVVFGADPERMVRDWMLELTSIARELRDVLRRAGRDELRVRAHPRDMIEMQQLITRQVRRVLLALFAVMLGVVGAMLYIAEGKIYLLIATLLASLLAFLVIFLLPTHLLANPFRRARYGR
jgi:predicted unusual protein kinase regulating ubiquinone biosynthesis (AarF/ABC1/UbiB family)